MNKNRPGTHLMLPLIRLVAWIADVLRKVVGWLTCLVMPHQWGHREAHYAPELVDRQKCLRCSRTRFVTYEPR